MSSQFSDAIFAAPRELRYQDAKMVLMLLRLGANPNEKDGRGRTMNQGRIGMVRDEPGHSFLNLISLKRVIL